MNNEQKEVIQDIYNTLEAVAYKTHQWNTSIIA